MQIDSVHNDFLGFSFVFIALPIFKLMDPLLTLIKAFEVPFLFVAVGVPVSVAIEVAVVLAIVVIRPIKIQVARLDVPSRVFRSNFKELFRLLNLRFGWLFDLFILPTPVPEELLEHHLIRVNLH